LEGLLRLKEVLKAKAILHDAGSSRLIILSPEKDPQCTDRRGGRKGNQAVLKATKPWKTVGGMPGRAIADSQHCWCKRCGVEPVWTQETINLRDPEGPDSLENQQFEATEG
jgi:hypothetical protein